MKFRKLGRTGLDVGIIGLGGEYLEHASRETVISVIHEAMDNQINYFDLFMASPDARGYYGEALKGKRDRVIVAGHLGSSFQGGQYDRTRDPKVCEAFFEDLLRRLKSDYIDILMLHFVDEPDDFQTVFHSGGILEIALRLKKEGKARFLGMSSHKTPVSVRATESSLIDVLMFPVNAAYDALPGETAWPDGLEPGLAGPDPSRSNLFLSCARNNVGLIAMKPYAGGRLLRGDDPAFTTLSPVQCLHYTLSRPGVCTVVPGCKNVLELRAALAYLDAGAPELDFRNLKFSLLSSTGGKCMYCNHCLPCPSLIDVAEVIRLVDVSLKGAGNNQLRNYQLLRAKGSDCIECGDCVNRCPFGVDVISHMHKAVELFGG